MQAVPQTRGPNFWDLRSRLTALPRLQDGVANSEKPYWSL